MSNAFVNRCQDIDLLKKQIDDYRPFSAQVVQQLKEYYRIGTTYTSNALEGNTLTETETKIVLEDGLTIGGKPLKDHLEALGLGQAYDYLYTLSQKSDFSLEDIVTLHKLFYYRIDLENAGVYRKVNIIVTGTDFKFPAPLQLEQAMKSFMKTMHEEQGRLHPVQYAAQAHLQLVTIHPFIDGNGRAARLLMNLILLQHGYALCLISPVMRREYLDLVRRGNKGDVLPFFNFISEMTYETHKDYIRLLKQLHAQ